LAKPPHCHTGDLGGEGAALDQEICDPAASRCRPAHRCIESITMWRHALLTDERPKWTEAYLDRSNRPIRRR
jgi:hypothetical protein